MEPLSFAKAAADIKPKDVSSDFPNICQGGREEIAAQIEQFMDGLRELFQIKTDLPDFLRIGGTAVLDAWKEFKSTRRLEPDRRKMFQVIDAFAAQAFEELSQEDAIDGVVQSSRLFDRDPIETLSDVVAGIEHLRLMFAMMIEGGDDFFFEDKIYDKVLQSLSAYDAELQIDLSAQSKNFFEDIVFPLIRYYVAPRLTRIVEDQRSFPLAYVHALADFYGSVEFLRMAFAREELKPSRAILIQSVKDSDLDELAEDLEDFTVDAEVDSFKYHLGTLAYVLSAEEEFDVDPVEALAMVQEAFPFGRNPGESIEKGRAAMLYRIKHLLDMAMPDGAHDRKLMATDVRYREAFNVMNDVTSREDGQSRIGAMAQMSLEKYLVPVLDEFTASADIEEVATFWVPIMDSTYIAASLHGMFEPSISLNQEMFKFHDKSAQWLEALADCVRTCIGAQVASSRPFFEQDRPIGVWVSAVSGALALAGVGVALVAAWAEYKNKAVSQAVVRLARWYVETSKVAKVAIVTGVFGAAMATRSGFGFGTEVPTGTSLAEHMAFYVRDNVRAALLSAFNQLGSINQDESGSRENAYKVFYDYRAAYVVGAVVANNIAIASLFTTILAAYYDKGDARPGALKKRSQAVNFRGAFLDVARNLLGLNVNVTSTVLNYGSKILALGGSGMLVSIAGNQLGLDLSVNGGLLAGLMVWLTGSGSTVDALNTVVNSVVANQFVDSIIAAGSVGFQALDFALYASPVFLYTANVVANASTGASRLNRSELAMIMTWCGLLFGSASAIFFHNIEKLDKGSTPITEDFTTNMNGVDRIYVFDKPGKYTLVLQGVALTAMIAQTAGVFSFLADGFKEALGYGRSKAADEYRRQAIAETSQAGESTRALSDLVGAQAIQPDWIQEARRKGAEQVIEMSASALEMRATFNDTVRELADSIQAAKAQL